MYSRSEIRHACFRAKNGALTDKNKKIVEIVKPLLKTHQRFDNFTTEWDILVTSGGAITIIKPEVDIDFIKATCLEKQFQVKYGVGTEMTPRKQNIITIVEIMMLDGKMTWENFEEVWSVQVDLQLKTISTKLFISRTQIPVTEEMIQASKQSEDDSEHTGKTVGVVELTPVVITKEEFNKLLTIPAIR